jgi:hypothetical protein
MHAVTVSVTVDPSHAEEAQQFLQSNVVPAVKQSPGIVSGYWLGGSDGRGITVLVYESEQAAQGAADAILNTPRPEGVTLGDIEVREVVAQI